MTTQRGDVLIESDRTFRIKPFPLDQLGGSWAGNSDRSEEVFRVESSACWRGYVATWELRGDQLVLTKFEAKSGATGEPLGMLEVFGVDELPAFWFSGKLFASEGEIIHGMFEPTFERDRVWVFARGKLLEQYVRVNLAEDVPSYFRKRESVTSNPESAWAPTLGHALDRAAEAGFDKFLNRDQLRTLEENLDGLIKFFLDTKHLLVKDYDSDLDIEWTQLRDAWQEVAGVVESFESSTFASTRALVAERNQVERRKRLAAAGYEPVDLF